ncbi:MAG: alginate export family protein [Bacteroidota bacterium]
MKIIILFLIIPLFAFPQETLLRWNGELRIRTEADGRDFNLKTAPNLYTLSRIRLGAEIQPVQNVSITLIMQDSRRFGEEPTTTTNNKNLDLYEGYAKLDSFLLPQLSVKAGRFAISCGSDRILGRLNWNNIGRAFDGLLVHYGVNDGLLDLFAVNISDVNTLPDPVNVTNTAFKRDEGTMMLGGYYIQPFGKELTVNIYALEERNKNTLTLGNPNLLRTTSGIHLKGTIEELIYETDAAYQFGSVNGTTISAWMAAFSIGQTITGSPVTSVSLNTDIISGTDPSSTEVNTFVPPYATGHKFYGMMDYFINFQVQTYNRGLMDIYLRGSFVPLENTVTTVSLHHFVTQKKFSANESLQDFGQELDILTQFKYNRSVSFDWGISAFVPGKIMRGAFFANDVSYWSYLSALVVF